MRKLLVVICLFALFDGAAIQADNQFEVLSVVYQGYSNPKEEITNFLSNQKG